MSGIQDKPHYKLPKYLKATGKLLLKAASEGERTFFKGQTGGNIIDDFAKEFHFAIRLLLQSHENILAAYLKLFDQIKNGSSTEIYRALGRLDGAMEAMAALHQQAISFELKDADYKGLEQSGVELLKVSIASILKYALETEKKLGQQLFDAERFANEHPEKLDGHLLHIKVEFDNAQTNDKLRVLINWFHSYLSAHYQCVVENKPSIKTNESIDPIDAAVIGYVLGSH